MDGNRVRTVAAGMGVPFAQDLDASRKSPGSQPGVDGTVHGRRAEGAADYGALEGLSIPVDEAEILPVLRLRAEKENLLPHVFDHLGVRAVAVCEGLRRRGGKIDG